jgi:heme-degrading monooxygenase HmoA
MFAVVFEVEPKPERRDEYLAIAAELKPKLEAIDGFVDVDRFASKCRSGRVLSLSTWRNEKALIRWRTHGEHHQAQEKGRFGIFSDYRLRVGEIAADTQWSKDARVEQDRFDTTEASPAKLVTITDIAPNESDASTAPALLTRLGLGNETEGLVEYDVFESIYTPGKFVLLVSWRDAAAAQAWRPVDTHSSVAVRQRHVRIIRDYGMFERDEAPQFYASVTRPAREADKPRREAAR